jgi:hypothetical protein
VSKPKASDIYIGETLPDRTPALDLPFPDGADVIVIGPFSAEPYGFPNLSWEDHGMVVEGEPGDWPAYVLRHPEGPVRTVQVWRRIIRDTEAGWSLVQSWRPGEGTSVGVKGMDDSSIRASTAYQEGMRLLDMRGRKGRTPGTYDITDPTEIIDAWDAVNQEHHPVIQQDVADQRGVTVETLQSSMERLGLKWSRSGPPVPRR